MYKSLFANVKLRKYVKRPAQVPERKSFFYRIDHFILFFSHPNCGHRLRHSILPALRRHHGALPADVPHHRVDGAMDRVHDLPPLHEPPGQPFTVLRDYFKRAVNYSIEKQKR